MKLTDPYTEKQYSKGARNAGITLFVLFCAFLALAYCSAPANAETRLHMGVGTHHWNGGEYREDNWLIAAQHGPVFGATFVNSLDNRSWALGYSVATDWDVAELGAHLGGVHGYNPDHMRSSPCVGDVCGFVSPYATVWLNDGAGLTGMVFGEALIFAVSVRWL